MKLHVIIVRESGTIKECIVVQRQETATALYELLRGMGKGVSIIGRELDAVPFVLVEAALGVTTAE